MIKLIRVWVCLTVVCLALGTVTVHAQDDAAAVDAGVEAVDNAAGGEQQQESAGAPGQGTGFVDIVYGDSIVNLGIWLLIFGTSFATIALMVNGALVVRREKMLPAGVVNGVRQALDQGDLGAAMAICEQNPGPLSNILMAGFTNITEGYEVVQEAVAKAADLESEQVMQRINYLNLCGQIAPMLGLLGTVTGMVKAFQSLATAGANKDQLLAQAISTALWTTVSGLLISVPALLAFTVYKNMAVKIILESEATVLDLIKILRGAEVEDEEYYEEFEEE